MYYSKIKEVAKKKNISLKELALKINVSETGFHQSIRSESMRIDVIEKIAKELDVNVCVFFTDHDNNVDIINLKAEIKSLKKDHKKYEKYISVLEGYIDSLKKLYAKEMKKD